MNLARVINIISVFVMGCTLPILGHNVFTKEFWILFFIVICIDTSSRAIGFMDR